MLLSMITRSAQMTWNLHLLQGLVYTSPLGGLVTHSDYTLQAWSDCVSFGDFESYRDRFERIQNYFAPRFSEAVRVGNEMMKTILEKTEKPARAPPTRS